MGIHNKIRKDKMGENLEGRDSGLSKDFSSMDLEINQEIPIDNPS